MEFKGLTLPHFEFWLAVSYGSDLRKLRPYSQCLKCVNSNKDARRSLLRGRWIEMDRDGSRLLDKGDKIQGFRNPATPKRLGDFDSRAVLSWWMKDSRNDGRYRKSLYYELLWSHSSSVSISSRVSIDRAKWGQIAIWATGRGSPSNSIRIPIKTFYNARKCCTRLWNRRGNLVLLNLCDLFLRSPMDP